MLYIKMVPLGARVLLSFVYAAYRLLVCPLEWLVVWKLLQLLPASELLRLDFRFDALQLINGHVGLECKFEVVAGAAYAAHLDILTSVEHLDKVLSVVPLIQEAVLEAVAEGQLLPSVTGVVLTSLRVESERYLWGRCQTLQKLFL